MAINYALDSRNILRVKVPQVLTTEIFISYLEEIIKDDKVSLGQVAIVNLDKVNELIIHHSDLLLVEELLTMLVHRGRLWTVFIVSHSKCRSMLDSMAQIFCRANMEVSICDSAKEAEEVVNIVKRNHSQEFVERVDSMY